MDAWPHRAAPRAVRNQPELFPLPQFPAPDILGAVRHKKARRRLQRRVDVWRDVNEAVDALNAMFGCDSVPLTAASSSDAQIPLTPAHTSVHRHLLNRISERRPAHVLSPRAAWSELLGSRLDYNHPGDGSHVEPYDPERVSLPPVGSKPVPLERVLNEETWDLLRPDVLLADADVVQWRRENEPVSVYMDRRLESDGILRRGFLERLFHAGVLSFAVRRRGEIAPFFVSKKKRKQRLVLDCRQVNQQFRKPPRPELGAAEVYRDLEAEGAAQLFIGEADIQNCFYQCGIPAWLCEFFGFRAESASWARELGASLDVWGSDLPKTGEVYPVLTALPMGWNWAFYLVQRMHEEMIARQGFPRSRCLVGAWPPPSLKEGPIAAPYCDNLTVVGTSEAEVEAHVQNLAKAFEGAGFAMHDITWVASEGTPLGCHFRGSRLEVGPKPERVWRLKQAFRYLERGGRATGRQVECLLGHYTSEVLHERSALSVSRALYSFVRDSYDVPQPLWKSARFECGVAAGLLPVLGVDLK